MSRLRGLQQLGINKIYKACRRPGMSNFSMARVCEPHAHMLRERTPWDLLYCMCCASGTRAPHPLSSQWHIAPAFLHLGPWIPSPFTMHQPREAAGVLRPCVNSHMLALDPGFSLCLLLSRPRDGHFMSESLFKLDGLMATQLVQ